MSKTEQDVLLLEINVLAISIKKGFFYYFRWKLTQH